MKKNKNRRIINLTKKDTSQVLSLLDAADKWESKFFEKYTIEDKEKIQNNDFSD